MCCHCIPIIWIRQSSYKWGGLSSMGFTWKWPCLTWVVLTAGIFSLADHLMIGSCGYPFDQLYSSLPSGQGENWMLWKPSKAGRFCVCSLYGGWGVLQRLIFLGVVSGVLRCLTRFSFFTWALALDKILQWIIFKTKIYDCRPVLYV